MTVLLIATIKALESAINNRDFDFARSLLKDDMTYSGPFGAKTGRDAYLSDIIRLNIKFKTHRLIADKGQVAVAYDITVAGLTTPALGWFTLRNGKVDTLRTAFDPRPIITRLEAESPA
jgi:hypothetical protein